MGEKSDKRHLKSQKFEGEKCTSSEGRGAKKNKRKRGGGGGRHLATFWGVRVQWGGGGRGVSGV